MQQAYEEIKKRIITLELPPGTKIDDYEMSRELEISRTPVREAIFLLGSEGLVDVGTHAGFTVRALDLLDIASLFEAHVVLAKTVARLAPRRATPEDIDAMAELVERVEEAIDRRDYLAITANNAELHKREAMATRNPFIGQLARQVHDQGQRLAFMCFGGSVDNRDHLEDHFDKVRSQHRALLEGMRNKKPDLHEIAVAHVRLFRERVQNCLVSNSIEGFELTDEDLALVGARLSD